jgi:serine protease Do
MGCMKTRILFWVLTVFVSVSEPAPVTGSVTGQHIYPLPLTEAEHVITEWLTTNAFQIDRQLASPDRVRLIAAKAQSRWEILLSRYSALAARVHLLAAGTDEEADADIDPVVKAFWQHIENYIQQTVDVENTNALPIPASVRTHRSAVVCIYADSSKGYPMQITGFVVDTRGLIVCTGHDLDTAKAVRVRLADGRQPAGRIVKHDTYRDLALVRVHEPLAKAVPLQNGRTLLSSGDMLFAITCSNGVPADIQTGYLEGPPRRVSGLALWQARMYIAHGSSGSPVFDDRGHLAAIVKGRYRGTASVGFLIPLETLLQFLDQNQ